MTPLDRLNRLLDDMDHYASAEGTDPPTYWRARDAALDLVDAHPELIPDARAYGLPV